MKETGSGSWVFNCFYFSTKKIEERQQKKNIVATLTDAWRQTKTGNNFRLRSINFALKPRPL